MIKAYFDGACEPINPGGFAGAGAVIFINNKRVWEYSELFKPTKKQQTSNNTAEYQAFIAILEELIKRKLTKKKIKVYGDSMLVMCQCLMDDPIYKKRWQIKKGAYVPYAYKALELLEQFSKIEGSWIPREENSIADELSKKELIDAGVEFRIQPEK